MIFPFSRGSCGRNRGNDSCISGIVLFLEKSLFHFAAVIKEIVSMIRHNLLKLIYWFYDSHGNIGHIVKKKYIIDTELSFLTCFSSTKSYEPCLSDKVILGWPSRPLGLLFMTVMDFSSPEPKAEEGALLVCCHIELD